MKKEVNFIMPTLLYLLFILRQRYKWNFTLNYNLSMQGTNPKQKAFGNAASFGKKFMNKKLTTLYSNGIYHNLHRFNQR